MAFADRCVEMLRQNIMYNANLEVVTVHWIEQRSQSCRASVRSAHAVISRASWNGPKTINCQRERRWCLSSRQALKLWWPRHKTEIQLKELRWTLATEFRTTLCVSRRVWPLQRQILDAIPHQPRKVCLQHCAYLIDLLEGEAVYPDGSSVRDSVCNLSDTYGCRVKSETSGLFVSVCRF